MQRVNNFIGGRFQESCTQKYYDNVCPATASVFSQVCDSSEEDIEEAVVAAKEAFETWSQTEINERIKILKKISILIETHKEELARIESQDQGKPVQLALNMDITRSAYNFSYFASALEQLSQNATQSQKTLNYTWRQPLGVVGLITPWNLPLYLLTWKLAPALAMGNTVVCKPSEYTPMSAFFLADLLNEAALPKGVCNFVFGHAKCGQALVSHPEVKAISFTGGSQTGMHIYQQAALQCKKISLELGGKNAQVVFADTNIDKCVEETVRACFLNQGEICLCTSRLYVEESIYSQFLDKFIEATNKLVVGDPSESESFMGAMNHHGHYQKVNRYIQQAKNDGAQIHTGTQKLNLNERCQNGYFIPPTIISGLSDEHPIWHEEIFGPVVCVSSFSNEKELLQRVNGVRYGLSASVWTENLSKAHRIAQKIDVGQVWVNTWMKRDLRVPFGGVKHSGLGREGGTHSLEFFSEIKNICVQL